MILNINGTDTTIAVDDSSYRYRAIMGENSLTLTFALPGFLDIPVGSYCDFQGERYTLTKPQNFKKNNVRNFDYTLILDSSQSQLEKYKFRDTNDGGRLKFSLTAKPTEHLAMLVANLNLRDTGWAVGASVDAPEKTIAYNHTFCIDALKQIAEAFETEWEVNGKTINLRKVEYNKTTPLALSYGRGNGFKPGVGRTNMDNAKPVEILFVQGGNRNIDPSKYGAKELLLPKSQSYTYEGRTYQTDAAGLSVRRSDKALVTMEEDSLDLSNVYPSRVGTITSVTTVDAAANFYDFVDTSIPLALDYKACLIAGETMTVIFQSGMLVGRELEVSYDHAARKFAIVPQELDGITMPGGSFIPAAGDKYAVFGIQLPDAYICDNTTQTGGSWDMLKQAVKYLYENEDPRFSFTGELDGIWAKANWLAVGGKLILGGYISFTDTQFQATPTLIRIVGIKDYINNPYKPQIELSNITIGPTVASSLAKIETNEVVTEQLHRDAIQYTKRRIRDAKETIKLLSEATLNFTDSISPITIQTMQALIGEESLQFRFVNNKTAPIEIYHAVTYNPDTKILNSAAGIIQHMTLGIATISSSHAPAEYKFWDVTGYTSPALEDAAAYYLYAKVSTTGTTGEFVLSATAIKMEAQAGYYHLLLGILGSEYEGARSFAELYGFTEILPGRITTNRMVSADGYNWLDFVNNAFHVGNPATFLDWNGSGDGKLRIKGTIIQNGGGIESMLGVFRGAYDAGTTYYQGDDVTYSGSTYRLFYSTPVTGIAPTNTTYWIVIAAGGTGTGTPGEPGPQGPDGPFFEYRYSKNGSTTVAPTITIIDTNPTGWTTTIPAIIPLEYVWMTVAKKSAAGALLQNWSTPTRITPADGKNATDGVSGSFFEYRYAKNTSTTTAPTLADTNPTPPGWTTTIPTIASGEYIWATVSNKTTEGTLLQNWSIPIRISGSDGRIGDTGVGGPAMAFQGAYNQTRFYYGTTLRVDAVKYSGEYYLARTDAGLFSGVLPTDTSKWNSIGAQFDQIATGLLLAEMANIADWIIKNGKITSQNTLSDQTTPRAVLDGASGAMTLKTEVSRYTPTAATETVVQSIDIKSTDGMIKASTGDNNVAWISSQGILANKAGTQAVSAATGIEIKAAIVGLGNGNLMQYAYTGSGDAICGVFGAASNSYIATTTPFVTTPAPSWGGLFYRLLANGLYLRVSSPSPTVNSTMYLNDVDTYVSCYNTTTLYIYLPATPQKGQIIFIRRINSSNVTVYGNGNLISTSGLVANCNVGAAAGDAAVFVWDGNYWMYNYLVR